MPPQQPAPYRDAQSIMDEMRRYNQALLSVALSQSFRTFQVVLSDTVRKLIIETSRPRVFMLINADPTNAFFIGDKNVTTGAGFPVLAQNPLTFGMAENVELWAIGNVDNIVAYVLDLGY